MKHIVLLTLTASLFLAACAEKSQMKIRGRALKEGPQQKAELPIPEDSSEKANTADPQEETSAVAPESSNTRKMLVNNKTTHQVYIGHAQVPTSLLCSDNLAKTVESPERIKVQGQSQIVLLQVERVRAPEAIIPTSTEAEEPQEPKLLVNFTCTGESADLNKEEENKNVSSTKLVAGQTVEITGKFDSTTDERKNKALIGCLPAEKMGEAKNHLLPEEGSDKKAVDILMAVNSKMMIEIPNSEGEVKKHVLVVCEAAAEEPK